MAWRLARLLDREGAAWRFWLAGQERRELLPTGGSAGDLVLLEGEPGDWRALCGPLHAGVWPEDLPRSLAGIARTPAPQPALFAVRGGWLIDAEGRPCEHGLLRTEDGFARVLSYAGWRLGDLEGQPLPLQQVALAEGALLLLEAAGCPEPLEAEARLPRDPPPVFETVGPLPPVVTAPPVAEPPAPEPPAPEPPPEEPVRQLGLFGF